MTAVHHLDDVTLMRFASGDLDEAFAVAIAAHLELCGECRTALRTAEACGGRLLELTDISQVSNTSFDHLRDHIERNEAIVSQDRPATQTPKRRASTAETSLPKPLHRYVGTSLDEVAWKTIAPGVLKRDITLSTTTANKLYMLKIAAGREMPEHGHGGAELTLVLSGAYQDKHGRFGRGDIADLDEHDEHQPKVEGDRPCVCLVAAQSHTKPKGLIARIFRPLIGI